MGLWPFQCELLCLHTLAKDVLPALNLAAQRRDALQSALLQSQGCQLIIKKRTEEDLFPEHKLQDGEPVENSGRVSTGEETH